MIRRLDSSLVLRGLLTAVFFVLIVSAQAAIGRITASEGASILSKSGHYGYAKTGTLVSSGDAFRTERKCLAEVTFSDNAVIRMNEWTDVLIHSASPARVLRLTKGALWVRDGNGSHTQVETPVCTVVARGTTFTVNSAGLVQVFDGDVDVAANGLTVTLGPGDVGAIGLDGKPIVFDTFSPSALATNAAGEPTGWWEPAIPEASGRSVGETGLGALTLPLAVLGATGNQSTPAAPVPEPLSALLLAFSAAWLMKKRASR